MVTTASFSMLLKKKLQRYKKIEKLVRGQNIPVDSSKLVDATKEITPYFYEKGPGQTTVNAIRFADRIAIGHAEGHESSIHLLSKS